MKSKNKNPWMEHLNKIKKQHPKLSLKERMKLAKETYEKKKGKATENKFVTQKEFEKSKKYQDIGLLLWFGLILVIPVIYSILANQKNYFGFYAMFIIGIIVMIFGIVKYFKWRKKYG